MMGRREDGQGQFFYSFDLDEVVPPDHLVRQIDTVFDLSWVHKELAPYYSHTGRPSIDPVLMIRMLIVGYVFAIRSERRLCSEVQVNLAYRWFCKLGIEDNIPDHSVFCRARHERFRESDALRRVFEGVVAMCIAAGVVGGEAFSVDASLIKADVDKKKRMPGDQLITWPKAEEASHAVREYELTSSSIGSVISTFVRVAQNSSAPATSIKATSSITEPARTTARSVHEAKVHDSGHA
jgi:transposase